MAEFNVDTWRAERAKARRGDDDKIDQLCDLALNLQARVRELEALTEELKKALKSPTDRPTTDAPPFMPVRYAKNVMGDDIPIPSAEPPLTVKTFT